VKLVCSSATRAISLGDVPLEDLRKALNQNRPFGNERFYAEIEAVTGRRCDPRKRGRPKKASAADSSLELEQQELAL
jgi:hypothetical protein